MKKIIILMAMFLIAFLALHADWILTESFESETLPNGWTAIDQDNDGNMWRTIQNASHSHTGQRTAFCEDFLPHVNNDWLITPHLTIRSGDVLEFYSRSWISTENMNVKISTTGNVVNNFTTTALALTGIGTNYQLYSVNLNNYAGQSIYIGFQWICTNYGICLDDIRVGHYNVTPPQLNLPDSFSFIRGETLSVLFTPYITVTDTSLASLTVSGNTNINVQINNRRVIFNCPNWTGTENLTFSLNDGLGSPPVTDAVNIIVMPIPVNDLALTQILSPETTVYINHGFYPSVRLKNTGNGSLSETINISCVIVNANNVTVYDQNTNFSGLLQPSDSTIVTYSQLMTPQFTGNHTITFTINRPDGNMNNNSISLIFSSYEHFGTGGPDQFGYQWIDSWEDNGPVYNWIDISATGTSTIMYGVNQWSGDDNFSEPIPIGFSFPFYGIDYTNCYVDINGELLLGNNTWYHAFPGNGWDTDGNMFNYMYPIPGYTQMPGLISVLWDDLEAVQGTGNIYFQTLGTAPNRYLVIQWKDIRFLVGTGLTAFLNFEVLMYENGEIIMQYQNVATGQTGSAAPHDWGQSSTVAIQNQTAQIGLCYLREIVQNSSWVGVEPIGNKLRNNTAIRFYNGTDNQPPFISYQQTGNTFEHVFNIDVQITDMSELHFAKLYYNLGGGWQYIDNPLNLGENNYRFSLTNIPSNTQLEYYFSVEDIFGNSSILPTNAPQTYFSFNILPMQNVTTLLAYSGTQDYQHVELPIYQTFFANHNITYDIFNWEEFSTYRFPSQYRTIYCYASTGSNVAKSDTLSMALMQFLDNGSVLNPKGLYFSSDGFAFTQSGFPNSSPMKKLFNAYFRSFAVPTGSGGGTNGLGGPDSFIYQNGTIVALDNSPIGDTGFEVNVYANSPDCIFRYSECPSWYEDQVVNPTIGANNAFIFEGGPFDGHAYLYHGVCATWIDNLIYRAFYFSFDTSQISDSTVRDNFLNDSYLWLNSTTATDEPFNQPLQIQTLKCYPNPFNPSTTITINSKYAGEKSELVIYNLKGEKVKTIYNGFLQKGSHKFNWNGTDENNNKVASGVYFCRFKNKESQKTIKLLLLK